MRIRSILFLGLWGWYTACLQAQTPSWQAQNEGTWLWTSKGRHVAICFAGWSVQGHESMQWAQALQAARLQALGVGWLWAVAGPREVGFESLEIDTKALADSIIRYTKANDNASQQSLIYVVAHSSGAYVAHNFFTHLFARLGNSKELDQRILYYCLDGGLGTDVYGTTFTPAMAQRMRSVVAVVAHDRTTGLVSPNAESMAQLATLAPERSTLRVMLFERSECQSRWCLHDALINKRPYNPQSFQLADDYGHINELHPVCWEYLR